MWSLIKSIKNLKIAKLKIVSQKSKKVYILFYLMDLTTNKFIFFCGRE